MTPEIASSAGCWPEKSEMKKDEREKSRERETEDRSRDREEEDWGLLFIRAGFRVGTGRVREAALTKTTGPS